MTNKIIEFVTATIAKRKKQQRVDEWNLLFPVEELRHYVIVDAAEHGKKALMMEQSQKQYAPMPDNIYAEDAIFNKLRIEHRIPVSKLKRKIPRNQRMVRVFVPVAAYRGTYVNNVLVQQDIVPARCTRVITNTFYNDGRKFHKSRRIIGDYITTDTKSGLSNNVQRGQFEPDFTRWLVYNADRQLLIEQIERLKHLTILEDIETLEKEKAKIETNLGKLVKERKNVGK